MPDIVTTDFFAFDDSADTFGLQGRGAAVEMGDAVLGMVVGQLGAAAPEVGGGAQRLGPPDRLVGPD